MRAAIGWTQNCATENDPRTRFNEETLIMILPQTFLYLFLCGWLCLNETRTHLGDGGAFRMGNAVHRLISDPPMLPYCGIPREQMSESRVDVLAHEMEGMAS